MKRVTIMDVILEANTPPKISQRRIVKKLGWSDQSRGYLSKLFNGHLRASSRQCSKLIRAIRELKKERKSK